MNHRTDAMRCGLPTLPHPDTARRETVNARLQPRSAEGHGQDATPLAAVWGLCMLCMPSRDNQTRQVDPCMEEKKFKHEVALEQETCRGKPKTCNPIYNL